MTILFTGDSYGNIKVWEWDHDKLSNSKTFKIKKKPHTIVAVADRLYVSFRKGIYILDSSTGEEIEMINVDGYITNIFKMDTFALYREVEKLMDKSSRLVILKKNDEKNRYDKLVIDITAQNYAMSNEHIFFQTGEVIKWKSSHDIISETLKSYGF